MTGRKHLFGAKGKGHGIGLVSPLGTLVIVLMIVSFFPFSAAEPKLTVYDVQVSANPTIQRPGLPIDIMASVGFGGGCCYPIEAHDMKAEIFLSGNMTLLNGEKVQYLTSKGQAAGTLVTEPTGLSWIYVQWTISSQTYGTQGVSVQVTGTNEEGDNLNVTASANIAIAAPITILVRDGEGTGIAGAAVTIMNHTNAIVFTGTTDENGAVSPYLVPTPTMGTGSDGLDYAYTITATKGKSAATLRAVTVTAGQSIQLVPKETLPEPTSVPGFEATFVLAGTAMAMLIGMAARRKRD